MAGDCANTGAEQRSGRVAADNVASDRAADCANGSALVR